MKPPVRVQYRRPKVITNGAQRSRVDSGVCEERAQYVSLRGHLCGSGGSCGRRNPLSSLFSIPDNTSNPTLSANHTSTVTPCCACLSERVFRRKSCEPPREGSISRSDGSRGPLLVQRDFAPQVRRSREPALGPPPRGTYRRMADPSEGRHHAARRSTRDERGARPGFRRGRDRRIHG
jgi:hypothetical protein